MSDRQATAWLAVLALVYVVDVVLVALVVLELVTGAVVTA